MRCYDLIQEARDLLNDPTGKFYSDEFMLRSANRTLREVMNRATTVREVQYTSVVEDQAAYGLPNDLLRVQRCAYFYRNDWCPLVKTSLDLAQWMSHEQTFRTEQPYYYDLWGRGRVEKYSGGVAGADADSFFLRELVGGVKVGDVILNVEDGSEAVITEVDVNLDHNVTIVHNTPFVGGTRSTLLDLDAGINREDITIRIVSHYVFPHVLWIAPPPTHTSDPGNEPLWVYMIRTHYEVTQGLMDEENDVLEVDLELETCVLYRLLYWASLQENGPEDTRTMKYQTDYESEYFKQQPYIRNRIHEFESTWGKPSARRVGYGNVSLSGVANPVGHVFNRNTL